MGTGHDHVLPATVDLGVWTTPLEPADRLGTAVGLQPGDLWLKRDDWLGHGGGGNKLRKLERLCAVAIAGGATTLVTSGAAQSNYARLTAAAARRLGLEVVLVLSRPGQDTVPTGNLTLDGLFAAEIVWADGPPAALAGAVEEAAATVRKRGGHPAVLPFGGSNAVGASGYMTCGQEILAAAPDVAHVVCAVGSGGMMAGLVAALGAARVLGGHAGALSDPRRAVAELASQLTHQDVPPARLRLDEQVVGDGYEHPTPDSTRAMDLAGRHAGVILDPVYGAKAGAALLSAVEGGAIRPGERTVLVLTGGLPGLFGHPVAVELARRTSGPRPGVTDEN
jgi:D-cysteine desulfhydrase